MTLALKKFVQTAVRHGPGSYQALAIGGKPTWLISEINSNFKKKYHYWTGVEWVKTRFEKKKNTNPNWNKTGFKTHLKPIEFLWALESSRHASLPKFLLQTLGCVSASPSWGTPAFCCQDVENAETYQFPSYVSCYQYGKPKLSKRLTPGVPLYSHVKHSVQTTVYKIENTK